MSAANWSVTAAKVLLAGLAHSVGSVVAGMLIMALGVEMPALPATPSAGAQLALLFFGGLAMGAGLALLARGLAGLWWQRWGLLSLFVVLVNGVGTALESRIFTTLGGDWIFFFANAVAGVAVSLAVSRLFPAAEPASLAPRLRESFAVWMRPGRLWRFGVAILAFPFFYFLFGMIIAPIVMPHYGQLGFLVIPPMSTLLGVLFTRSVLFLVASLVVIAAWTLSRTRLALSLGLAHFVAVGLVGLIQTTFFPALLRWVHGIEILADSMFYAWILAWLFFPRAARRSQPVVEATGPAAAAAAGARSL